jgi:hypothetical protein
VIILDTNVLSETIRSTPNEAVKSWLKQQSRTETFVTAISKAEMLAGVLILPEGRRREALSLLVEQLFDSQFRDNLLSFDNPAADHYAEIVATRRRVGRPIGILDAQIAAIAVSRGAAVATRDTEGFSGIGVEIVDPWQTV